jgi:hypothetical protein
MLDQSLPTWALGTNTPGIRNFVTTRLAAMYLFSGLSHNEVINRVFDYDKQHNAPRLQAPELFNIVNRICDCGFHAPKKPVTKWIYSWEKP